MSHEREEKETSASVAPEEAERETEETSKDAEATEAKEGEGEAEATAAKEESSAPDEDAGEDEVAAVEDEDSSDAESAESIGAEVGKSSESDEDAEATAAKEGDEAEVAAAKEESSESDEDADAVEVDESDDVDGVEAKEGEDKSDAEVSEADESEPDDAEALAADEEDADSSEGAELEEDAEYEAFSRAYDGSSQDALEGVQERVMVMEVEPGELWGADPDPVIPPNIQPIVPLLLAILSVFVLYSFRDDLTYTFVDKTPIELGNIAQLGCSKAFYKKAHHNSYVRIRGILAQIGLTTEVRAQFVKRKYMVALGCELIVSLSPEEYKKIVYEGKDPEKKKLNPTYKRFSVTGRLLLAKKVGSLSTIRAFYRSNGVVDFTDKTYVIYSQEKPAIQWWLWAVFLLLSVFGLYCTWRFLFVGWEVWIKLSLERD